MVKIQLESGQYLDVKEGTAVPLTLARTDIREPGKRIGNFSKTITLSGSKNNLRILGGLYDVKIGEATFNTNKKVRASVIRDNIVVMDSLILQVLSINKRQDKPTSDDFVEFSAILKSGSVDFFTKIEGKYLTDIDLSDLNHIYSPANVYAARNNDANDGYTYPMGQNANNVYPLSEFVPAVYAKTYFDRIHQTAGFSYEWPELSETGFDKLVIPFNGEKSTIDYSDYLVDADKGAFAVEPTQPIGQNNSVTALMAGYTENIDNQNVFNPSTGVYAVPFNQFYGDYTAFNFTVSYTIRLNVASQAWLVSSTNQGGLRYRFIVKMFKNGSFHAEVIRPAVTKFDGAFQPFPGGIITSETNAAFTMALSQVNVGDDINFQVQAEILPINNNGGELRWRDADDVAGNLVQANVRLEVDAFNFTAEPIIDSNQSGQTISVNKYIPQKFAQSDFMSSFMKAFNLIVEPKETDPSILVYKTRDKYYDGGEVKDWSLKESKGDEQEIILLPDLTNKSKLFTYKKDSDYPNEVYTNSLDKIYGQAEYFFENEFAKGQDLIELAFSPTPVSKTTFGAIVPTIAAGSPKTNFRVLIHDGKRNCSPYVIDDGISPLTVSEYAFISHTDDPYNPSFDINFGVCDFYFYSGLNPTLNNLFNRYWRRTSALINSGKMFVERFNLTETDIKNLSLSDKIYASGAYWNINKVIDYDPDSSGLTKVELISTDDEIDLPVFFGTPVKGTVDGNPSSIKVAQKEVNDNNNTNLSESSYEVKGKGNTVQEGQRGYSTTDNQQIYGDSPSYFGDVEVGGDQATPPAVDPSGDYTMQNLTVNGTLTNKAVPHLITLTQAGTGDPVETIYNDKVGAIAWTRIGVGVYHGDVPLGNLLAFPLVFTSPADSENLVFARVESDTVIEVRTFAGGYTVNYPSDDILDRTPLSLYHI